MKLIIDKCTVIDSRDVYAVVPILGSNPDHELKLYKPERARVYLNHHSGISGEFDKVICDIGSAERIVSAISLGLESGRENH